MVINCFVFVVGQETDDSSSGSFGLGVKGPILVFRVFFAKLKLCFKAALPSVCFFLPHIWVLYSERGSITKSVERFSWVILTDFF